MDELTRRVADRLESRRVALGLTQTQLAAMTGVRQQDISRVLSQRAVLVPLGDLDAIATALGLRLSEILQEAWTPPSVDEEFERAVALLRALKHESREDYDALLRVIRPPVRSKRRPAR